jgi:hypothetical protein
LSCPHASHRSASGGGWCTRCSRGRLEGSGRRPCPLRSFLGVSLWGGLDGSVEPAATASSLPGSGAPWAAASSWPSSARKSESCSAESFSLWQPKRWCSALRRRNSNSVFLSTNCESRSSTSSIARSSWPSASSARSSSATPCTSVVAFLPGAAALMLRHMSHEPAHDARGILRQPTFQVGAASAADARWPSSQSPPAAG